MCHLVWLKMGSIKQPNIAVGKECFHSFFIFFFFLLLLFFFYLILFILKEPGPVALDFFQNFLKFWLSEESSYFTHYPW